MNLFKKTSEQMQEAFSAMPMHSRVISVMLVAAIAIGLGFLVRGGTTSNTEYLFGGRTLDTQELEAVELAFSGAKLNDWDREGRRIKIPRESRSEYLAALQKSSALPMSLQTSVQSALDNMSVFESNDLRLAREMHAKEIDLGKKISGFPDIHQAFVEYDRGERYGLGKSRPQSASVVVHPEGTNSLPRYRINQIKDLIRASYAGMDAEDVSVIDTNSTNSYAGTDEEDPILRKQNEVEMRIEQKVRSLMAGYPARIAVTAEIDPNMQTRTTSIKFDPEPTNLRTSSRKIESTTNQQNNRGTPGAGPNGTANRPVNLADTTEINRTKEDERESMGVAGQSYQDSTTAPLQVKKVRVSVALPDSYYKTLFQHEFLETNPDKTVDDVPTMDKTALTRLQDETELNIQTAISPLLPSVDAGADPLPLVSVTSYADLPQDEVVSPETAKIALTWLADSWQTLLLVFMGLMALMVARSAAKGGSFDGPPSEFQEGFGLELPVPSEEEGEDGEEQQEGQMTITGGTLVSELTELVENNPEVAANVIRGWVAEAA